MAIVILLSVVSQQVVAQLIDPTKPPDIAPAATSSGYQLSAIIIAPDHRTAVINGKLRHLGDKFDNLTLIMIEKNKVILQGADKQIVLTLEQDAISPMLKIVK